MSSEDSGQNDGTFCKKCGMKPDDDTVEISLETSDDDDYILLIHCTECGYTTYNSAKQAAEKGAGNAQKEFSSLDDFIETVQQDTAFNTTEIKRKLSEVDAGKFDLIDGHDPSDIETGEKDSRKPTDRQHIPGDKVGRSRRRPIHRHRKGAGRR